MKNIALSPTDVTLEMWNSTTTHPVGKCRLKIRNPSSRRNYSVEFTLVDSDCTSLLGRKVAEYMQLITVNYENLAQIHSTHESEEPDVLSDYPEVFDGSLATLSGIVRFHVDETAPPVISRPRTIPVSLEKMYPRNWTV